MLAISLASGVDFLTLLKFMETLLLKDGIFSSSLLFTADSLLMDSEVDRVPLVATSRSPLNFVLLLES